METWQLQEAKNKFSEVVERARKEGPQVVTRRGVETVVVIAYEDYRRMSKPEKKLSDLMRGSPLFGVDLDLDRQKDPPRDLDL